RRPARWRLRRSLAGRWSPPETGLGVDPVEVQPESSSKRMNMVGEKRE
ncbi:hypothetical protein A2U01_0022858, partial [Trifolium medium]|nr:hypothetical protein [Trifolium medium]